MYAENNATAYNSNIINVNGYDARGMYADSITVAGSVVNNSDGTININHSNAYGLYANGNYSQATNNGNINVEGSNSFAMYTNVGVLSNDSGSTINISGSYSSGMYTDNGGSATNNQDAEILASGAYTYGLYGKKGNVTNYGSLTASGSYSNGMRADADGTATNETGAIITVSGASAYGMYNNGGSVTNYGDISVSKENASGMHSASGDITNSAGGTITVSHTSAKGMSTTSAKAINSGEISVENGYGMYNKGGLLTNNGGITISGTNSYGLYSTNGNIFNEIQGTINVESNATTSASAGYGIYISGVDNYAENKGDIVVNGNGISSGGILLKTGPVGIYTTSNATAQNSGSISVTGFDAKGMYATNGASITNNSTFSISVESADAYGMLAVNSDSSAQNEGAITINGDNAIGMYTYGDATATNASNAVIVVSSGDNARAMYASNEGALINNGQITLNAENSYGMYVDDGATKASSATNNNVISTRADGAIGMYANGNNALITNNKEIIVSGGDAYGMYVNGSASKAASGINNATIEVSGENSRGMFVEGTNASITNNKTITVSGANSVGMYAKGSGATATNASGATITISATASDSFAMYAEYGGTIINNGTIIINNLTSYGMCAFDYGSSATNTDSSSAHIYVLNEDVLINGLVALEGATAYGKDPEIKPATLTMSAVSPLSTTLLATKGSKIINNGLISTDSSLDFGNSNDDSGSINIGDGASFIATSFSGDVVADSNITLNGFESKYVNENSFVGEDNGLNITSGSYLFNADKTLNEDGNTDVVMTMKEFSEVVENSSLSDFLSDNYAEKNNENLFNSLKSTQTSAEFNRNINDLFGQNMLTSLTFEDLNVLRELNFDMNNNLFAQKKGSFTLSDGISMIEGEKFGSTGQYALSGYNDGTTSIAVGLAVSDVRSDVGTKRNNKLDKNIILSMPIGHKVGGFELVSSPKLGLAYGSYERDGLNGMNYEGKLERKMFALMNEARYPMILEGMKVIPSAEFNLVGYNIKGREDKKQYSLNIDSQNHYSVESGLGLNLEKVFTPYKNSKLKLNGGIAVYKEFADPYDLKVGMSDMSGSYNLKDEKHGDKRTLVRFGAEYKVKENLDISAMIRTNIDHEYRTDTGISLKYNF